MPRRGIDTDRFVSFEEDDTSAFVASGEVITRLVELDSRYDVRYTV